MSDEQHGSAPKQRVVGRPFQKGQSGNAAGRPKGVQTLATVKDTHLRDAILDAAHRTGLDVDPQADNGLSAYLAHLAKTEPKSFASLLARLLPLTPTRIDLPEIKTPSDLVTATGTLAKAVGDGDLSPADANSIAGVLGASSRAIELNQLEQRLAALEHQLAEKAH